MKQDVMSIDWRNTLIKLVDEDEYYITYVNGKPIGRSLTLETGIATFDFAVKTFLPAERICYA